MGCFGLRSTEDEATDQCPRADSPAGEGVTELSDWPNQAGHETTTYCLCPDLAAVTTVAV